MGKLDLNWILEQMIGYIYIHTWFARNAYKTTNSIGEIRSTEIASYLFFFFGDEFKLASFSISFILMIQYSTVTNIEYGH